MDCLQYLWFLLLGLGVGVLGTLIGAGGGFILMPILLLTRPDDKPVTLTAISLAVVCCNALSGSYWYARMKRIDFKSGLLFLLTGVPGAAAGAYVVEFVPREVFDLVFSLFLIAGGIYVFLKTFGNGRHSHGSRPTFMRTLVDAEGVCHNYGYSLPMGMALSFVIGLVANMLGLGGGIIQVPVMVNLLSFPVHLATATSHFMQAVMAAVGTVVHLFDGSLTRAEAPGLLAICVGVVVGARLGAHLSKRIHGRWIMRILAIALSLAGVRVLAAAIAAFLRHR
jgi:uncharacterized membrane protein YfcA